MKGRATLNALKPIADITVSSLSFINLAVTKIAAAGKLVIPLHIHQVLLKSRASIVDVA